MPKISIIMPVFNAKKYIDESIASVICQTYNDWELILIDDCSTDSTYDYLLVCYQENPKIKLLRNPVNSGAGASRNLGLKRASGQIIAFLDADDIWMPSKLEKQLTFMLNHKSAIIHTSYSFINESGEQISGLVNVSKHVNLNSYMRNTEIGMSTVLINKEIVGNFEFPSIRIHEDAGLWLELLGRGLISDGLNEVLVNYRVRKGQLSGNKIVAALNTFKLYASVTELPVRNRLKNYLFYAVNAIYKRSIK
ncbi:glycosyltransferase family 2 protein [Psychrobacter sp. ANT_H3]|uniref:glycosyltransferase family 2 protein n=1 Tax=Psychrobacter sp. ANT_H3 TaxID=3019444 RepID=UPI0022F1C805|nr:glycosyltransferase family 2 protein [Psychrobacter sp. ANT_H3]MDA5133710.1 glycosyltransferase family 2 protein [Psychrobacter sp. ANT_H3]